MKFRCTACNKLKKCEDFHKSKAYKSGYNSSCKECHLQKVREYRAGPGRKAYLESLKRYQAKDNYKRARKKYEQSEQGRMKRREHANEHRAKHSQKVRARNMAKYAIRKGDLKWLPCDICGDKNSQAHHEDYSKPLEVIFLCPRHHTDRHMNFDIPYKKFKRTVNA